jgi:hypothetical protein
MSRYRWPDEAVQTFTLKATALQAGRWIDAARSAGYKHTPKWLAEAADFYASYEKQQVERARKRELKAQKRVAERVRRVEAGLDPDTGAAP